MPWGAGGATGSASSTGVAASSTSAGATSAGASSAGAAATASSSSRARERRPEQRGGGDERRDHGSARGDAIGVGGGDDRAAGLGSRGGGLGRWRARRRAAGAALAIAAEDAMTEDMVTMIGRERTAVLSTVCVGRRRTRAELTSARDRTVACARGGRERSRVCVWCVRACVRGATRGAGNTRDPDLRRSDNTTLDVFRKTSLSCEC